MGQLLGHTTTTETTVSFDVLNAHISALAAVFNVELAADTLGGNGEFTFTVDGRQLTASSGFVTMLIYSGTTLELSFTFIQTHLPLYKYHYSLRTLTPDCSLGFQRQWISLGSTAALALTGSGDIYYCSYFLLLPPK